MTTLLLFFTIFPFLLVFIFLIYGQLSNIVIELRYRNTLQEEQNKIQLEILETLKSQK